MESTGIEIAIAVGSGTIGAIIGAIVGYYFSRRLTKQQQETDRAKAAYEACLKLRETLASWMNEITDATRTGQSSDAVRQNLRALFEHERYQGQVSDRLHDLREDPDCRGLFSKTSAFTSQAFDTKGRISMALAEGNLMRDYPRHRDEACRALRGLYDDFGTELERVIPLLKRKARL